MKLSDEFILRRVVDTAVLMPYGKKLVDLNGMLSLNSAGAFLAEQLRDETTFDELVRRVVEKFDVEKETAKRDVAIFLEQLKTHGALVE